MASGQRISRFLMFDGPVEEAAKLYVSVFPNSEIKSANPMSASIVANGTEILMFDGGPHFKFSPGISLFVKCNDQLADHPRRPRPLLGDPDREKANRGMQAMFKMKKIVVADLDRAAAA